MVFEYTEDMHEKVIHLALSDVSSRATTIWKIVSDKMNTRSTIRNGISDIQVKTLVHNTRSREIMDISFRFYKDHHYVWCKISIFLCTVKPSILDNDTKKLTRLWCIEIHSFLNTSRWCPTVYKWNIQTLS